MELGYEIAGSAVNVIRDARVADLHEKQQGWALFLRALLDTPLLQTGPETTYKVLLVTVESNGVPSSEIVVEVTLEGKWVGFRWARIVNHFERVERKHGVLNVQYEGIHPRYRMIRPRVMRMRISVDDKLELPFIPIDLSRGEEVIEEQRTRVYTSETMLLPELGATVPKNFIV